MDWNASGSLFLIGGSIGFSVALLGAAADYWLHLRRGTAPARGMPGCLVYTIGGLVLAGIVALAASLLLTGGVWPALILGAGVLAAFYLGFIVLFLLWVLVEHRRAGG